MCYEDECEVSDHHKYKRRDVMTIMVRITLVPRIGVIYHVWHHVRHHHVRHHHVRRDALSPVEPPPTASSSSAWCDGVEADVV